MSAVVKKYANRKLHLIGTYKYLTMVELSDLAVSVVKDRDPDDLKVVCDRTGRDLTLETLSRALYERLKRYYDEERFLETGRNKAAPFPAKDLMALIAQVPLRKKD